MIAHEEYHKFSLGRIFRETLFKGTLISCDLECKSRSVFVNFIDFLNRR